MRVSCSGRRKGEHFTFLLLLLVLFGPACLRAYSAEKPASTAERPRLAVLVFFDQMRGDYLIRWDKLFGEGGFHRLERDGTWFQNCHFPFAETVTAVGHASVATGCSPKQHGISGNELYDRASGKSVSCIFSERHERVPPRSGKEGEGTLTRKLKGISPERLLSPTLADALKAATQGQGRVVALSFKDRTAVLPGGRRPDACYWIDADTGEFVTSTYYRDRLHPWVEEFNRSKLVDQWFGKDWTRLRANLDYERYSGADNVMGEGQGIFQGRTFPHPLNGGPKQLKSVYYAALYNSPFGNELLLALAQRAIEAERLGTRDVPDLLSVSFSCNDPVGHTWGPDSQEVLDMTLRSDLIIKELFDFLDARVGKGRFVLAIVGDHGVCPLPEVAGTQGKKAARISPTLLSSKAEQYLGKQFGVGDRTINWVEKTSGFWIYLSREAIRRQGVKQSEVETALASWLRTQSGVQAAYTRTQLLEGVPSSDAVGSRISQSFDPERNGDVIAVLLPYHLLSAPLGSGTNHGSPHSYDTHVPLLVYGSGIRHGKREEAIVPQVAAVILARALGIKPPAGANCAIPDGLFEAPAK